MRDLNTCSTINCVRASSDIEQLQSTFELAARYERDAPNSCVVVLLDEVGLAEQSPHLPLKVLHKVLDESKGGSVVGISNWTLGT
jgi:hypothetical protein